MLPQQNNFKRRSNYFAFLGFSKKTFIENVTSIFKILGDYKQFKRQLGTNSGFSFGRFYPIGTDRKAESGSAKGHYFHQDLLVAQSVFSNNPEKHIDIGSRIDGFVSHVASFRRIEIFDIRPLSSNIPAIKFSQLDLMAKLDQAMIGYTDSLSSLHAIEHFGLGRYNDPIDANGHLKALDNIYLILKERGRFYFSAPIGPQRIEFNAHRVFCLKYLLELFQDKYTLVNFSFVDDDGNLHRNVTLDSKNVSSNCGCFLGCGIFEFKKN